MGYDDSELSVKGESQSRKQIGAMSEVHQFSATELDYRNILHVNSRDQRMLKVFRDLRTRIYAKAQGKNFVAMVTSVAEGGGASYVAKNLAASIVLDNTKTAIIVDCNFYAPTIDSLLGPGVSSGLTDFLAEPEMGVEYVVYASGIPRLRAIPAGKDVASATERLSSVKMKLLLRELRTRYADRQVVIDAPCVGEYVADARIMADLCDFVVLVVPYGKVTAAQIDACMDTIGQDKLAGVVFNYT